MVDTIYMLENCVHLQEKKIKKKNTNLLQLLVIYIFDSHSLKCCILFRYVNVVLCDASKPDSEECPCGTILLENPPGQYLLSSESLYQMVRFMSSLL